MANKTIKGITIALGADFSAVGKAVDGIDKKFRSMQTELRQVDKLLKLDPKNTELLAQKQDLLAQSIQGTRDRLTALQSAQEKVNKAFQEGKIDESQYRAYQREIAATEQTLKNLEKQEKETADAIEHANDRVKASAKEVEAAKDSIKKVGDDIENVAEKAGKGLLAIGTAVAGAGTYCLNFSTDFDKALNNVITKTGATAEETAGLEKVMEGVYSNNFGEDIADVGISVATVKQQMKLAGEELQTTTENALMLRDTFDFEVKESTRAAKMLMDQFCISSEEAFTLIAQGAQNGLDKNGDLLDTINEYSVHFKQAGFDAESMFNMLINGTESGTFSVDKLGDTVKEFFIRAKDGSDSTIGAFQKLGLNANKMTKKFAEGGTSAYEAYQTVNEALFNLNDTVKQNEIGVALYGTMWEDLGADGVQALTNIDGAADQAANTLEQINKTQYDDLGSSLETLGRTMNTEIIRPLGDKLTPYVKDLAEEIKDHAPEIKDLVMDAAGGAKELISYVLDNKETVITTIGGVAAALAAAKIAKTISGIVSSVKNLGTAVTTTFSLISAHPIGALVTAIAGVVALAVGDIVNSSKEVEEEVKKLETISTEKLDTAFSNLLDHVQSFQDGISNAGTIYDNFNESLIVSADRQAEISQEMDNAQNTITEIARTATETRGSLTQQEIDRIDELLGKIQGLAAEELENAKAYQGATLEYASFEAENGNIDTTKAQQLINTAQQDLENVREMAEKQYNEEFATLQRLVKEQPEKYTQAWLESEMEESSKRRQEMLTEAEQTYSQTLEVIRKGNQDQASEMQKGIYMIELQLSAREQEQERHNTVLAELEQKKADAEGKWWLGEYENAQYYDGLIWQEKHNHQLEMKNIQDAMVAAMDENTIEQMSAQLYLLSETKKVNGELTEEQKTTAVSIVSAFQNVPAELRSQAESMLNELGMGLNENSEIIYTECINAGQRVADGFGLSHDDFVSEAEDMTTDADQTISGATFGPPKIDKFELSETPEQFIENTNSSFRDKYITVPARLDIQGSTGSSQIHFDKFINTNPVPHADGAVFNRKTLIGYTLSKNGLLGHTVAEAGREAILPLNRQVYSEIGEGVLRSMREKSMREITEPIRRMWEEDSIRVSAAYAATAEPSSPVNKVQAPVINQTNNITAPTPLSPYETARQVKIASQSLAWR